MIKYVFFELVKNDSQIKMSVFFQKMVVVLNKCLILYCVIIIQ